MSFDRRTCVIPDGSKFEEKLIWTSGDIVLENQVAVENGFRTDGRIFIGERVKVRGDLIADGDIRVDLFSTIQGHVTSKGNVYIGEGTQIGGKLSLEGNLDVGKNVEITEGFEAKGWINIRSSIPLVIYFFIYLVELLKRGHSEEVEKILGELDESQIIPISDTFFFIPNGSSMGQESVITGNMYIGKNCKVSGNFLVKGNVYIGGGTQIHGALRVTGKMTVEKNACIEGNVESEETIELGKCVIGGDLRAEKIMISPGTRIHGTIHAPGGVRFITKASQKMEEKVKRFKDNVTLADEIEELLP